MCNVPSPRWNITRARGWQDGGGLYIWQYGGGLSIDYGTATLTNTNVYANQAGMVCSPS